MKKLKVNLENCYGIKSFKCCFDFTKKSTYVIYAPNGTMKSSLAKTFQDVKDGKDTCDRIFSHRHNVREIKDENDLNLDGANVLVIKPYVEDYEDSSKKLILLVNEKLRKEYERIYKDIYLEKEKFLKTLQVQASTKKNIEQEIPNTFTSGDGNFFLALTRIQNEISSMNPDPVLEIVPYDVIFDEKVLEMLNGNDVKEAIETYIKKYNELLAKSTYFKKGIFNYYNGTSVAKQLNDNGFFKASHTIKLNSSNSLEINSQEELIEIINHEKDEILSNTELRKSFSV